MSTKRSRAAPVLASSVRIGSRTGSDTTSMPASAVTTTASASRMLAGGPAVSRCWSHVSTCHAPCCLRVTATADASPSRGPTTTHTGCAAMRSVVARGERRRAEGDQQRARDSKASHPTCFIIILTTRGRRWFEDSSPASVVQ